MKTRMGGFVAALIAAATLVGVVATTTSSTASAEGPTTPLALVGGSGVSNVYPTVTVGSTVSVPMSGCTEPDRLIEVVRYFDGAYTFLGYSGPVWEYAPAEAGIHELIVNCMDWSVRRAEIASGIPESEASLPILVNYFLVAFDVITELPNIPVDYVASIPGRLLDSRADGATVDGRFANLGIRTGVTEIQVAGRFGVPADAKAVALNVTVTETTGAGFVTVYPCGSVPNASNLNFGPGESAPNLVISALSGTGSVCLFTNVATHLIADLNGYFPATSGFEPLAPRRFLDTRPDGNTFDGVGQRAGLRIGVTEVQVSGRTPVPAGAAAAVLNVTATETTGPGFVTVYPCGTRPNASNLNFSIFDTIPNLVIAPVGPDGKVCLFSSASTHLIADVAGYLPAGTSYTGLTPGRLMDSRPDGDTVDGQNQRIGIRASNTVTELRVTNRHGVPLEARSVILNVTATNTAAAGFVKVFPCGTREPNASNLNFGANDTRPNAVIAKVGSGGRVCFIGNVNTNLIVDVAGYFLV